MYVVRDPSVPEWDRDGNLPLPLIWSRSVFGCWTADGMVVEILEDSSPIPLQVPVSPSDFKFKFVIRLSDDDLPDLSFFT
jgi:hypothetical protein